MTQNVTRETLGRYAYRRDAEFYARQARENGRENVVVTGEQGRWKVRADKGRPPMTDEHLMTLARAMTTPAPDNKEKKR